MRVRAVSIRYHRRGVTECCPIKQQSNGVRRCVFGNEEVGEESEGDVVSAVFIMKIFSPVARSDSWQTD